MSESVAYARNVRRNGWSLPLGCHQVAGWISLLCLVVIYYGIPVLYLPYAWRLLGIIAAAILLLVHVSAHVITASIDPRYDHARNEDKPGENLFCEACQTDVLVDTKHCRICNKCIDGFDHHCVWLNNCIAARNYRPFLVTLSTGFIIVTLFTIFMFVLFVMFFAARDQLCYLDCSSSNSTERLRLFGARVSDPVFPIITGIIILPSVIVDALLGHLLGFHIYFITKGITTYDHFVRIKSQNQKYPFLFCICPKKSNKIAPAENDLQNGDGWLATLDNHLMGSQDVISPSHDPDTRSHDLESASHDLESASHDSADESHDT